MLHAWRHPHTGEIRLYLRTRFSTPMRAWIAYRSPTPDDPCDWRIWIERPGSPHPIVAQCQLLLKVRSHLRAWLLHTRHRHLDAVRFAELCQLTREQDRRSFSI